MEFVVIYRPRNPSEESERRTLALFTNWEPPFEFKHHWARGDGEGGVAIIEADSAAQVLEGISPWAPYLAFEVAPAVPMEDAVPIFMKNQAWAESVA
jgi:hypothetical protein